MTSLESLAAGTPTLTYRPIPGHGTTNARALDLAGLVPWVADVDELSSALVRVLRVTRVVRAAHWTRRRSWKSSPHGLLVPSARHWPLA